MPLTVLAKSFVLGVWMSFVYWIIVKITFSEKNSIRFSSHLPNISKENTQQRNKNWDRKLEKFHLIIDR